MINAIKTGATTGEAIDEKITGIDGISKKIEFTPTGELAGRTILIYQVRGGAIVNLGPSTDATLR